MIDYMNFAGAPDSFSDFLSMLSNGINTFYESIKEGEKFIDIEDPNVGFFLRGKFKEMDYIVILEKGFFSPQPYFKVLVKVEKND